MDNATGLISSSYYKDVNDTQWANDDDVKAYYAFMKEYIPTGDPRNTNYSTGFINAHLITHVLKACGDDLSRENILRQATSLKDIRLPLLLAGVSVNTSKDDYLSFQQLRLRRFNGKSWEGFGQLLDDRCPEFLFHLQLPPVGEDLFPKEAGRPDCSTHACPLASCLHAHLKWLIPGGARAITRPCARTR